MSRIGKNPLELPKGVSMAVENGALVCKGPKGTLTQKLVEGVEAKVDGNIVSFARTADTKLAKAMHGTLRAIAKNMVVGVTQGYSKKLEIVGVGYKAVLAGKKLSLTVGFANIIEVQIPQAIEVKVPDASHVEIIGIDKQLVGQVAADIRAARKPEPYKGKGVRYADEVVRRKAGKAAASGGAKK
jgi:large subunit ribosomal protein L6